MTNTKKTLKRLSVSTALTVVLSSLMATGTSNIAFAQMSTAFNWNHDNENRDADKALVDAKVQIRYDGESAVPRLNVTANNGDVVVNRGDAVKFQTYWNYGAFIKNAEIRIFDATSSVQTTPLAVLPLDQNQTASLVDMQSLPDDVIYLVRAYDELGQFDETEAKPLSLRASHELGKTERVDQSQHIGYGIDRTAVRNIQIRGASVTVNGLDITQGDAITLNGQTVPVDSEGKFAVQSILPYGDHSIDVVVSRDGQRTQISRDVFLEDTNFFYVAIGDVTLGSNSAVGPANLLAESDEDFDDVALAGRGAMYLRGRYKGDYKVTAAIDTGEELIENIFTNFDQKDPRRLLRRLDSDRLYPVYGDDSTLVEDAPTQGRFYVRVEKDDSHVMWGNFVTQITGTELAHLDRGLYGAIADYNGLKTTSYGERVTQVTGFAADPGTIPAREEYRATGGSVYFLNRQDISIGSERVRVEIRDKVSGLVIETRDLTPQEDYDVDYIQGRVLLSEALQSTSNDNQIVRDGALSGNEVYIIVRYEYTPTLTDVDGYTVGGRATHWLGDHLRLGVTAQKETTDTADQDLFGVDAILRRSAGTYLKAEIAQTEGPGFDVSRSTDGGFLFDTIQTQGVSNVQAKAYRLEAAADLSEFSGTAGQLRGYYDLQENGFSGANRLVQGEVQRYGGAFKLDIGSKTAINLQYDNVEVDSVSETQALYGDVSHQFSENTRIALGIRHDNVETSLASGVEGARTDISGQINHRFNDYFSLLGFAQATLDNDDNRQRNNRYGLGADLDLTDRLSVQGEVSDGDGGIGANAQVTFERSDNSQLYLGYALSADRTDTGFATASQSLANFGTLTFGAKTRYNDSLSVYGEERIGYGDGQSSLNHVYGLTFNPSEIWSFGASVENGQIEDDVNGTFDRTAIALSAGRATEKMRFASNLEARFEDGVLSGSERDRTTWLMRNTLSYDANQNWEVLGRYNFAVSESDQADFLDAEFVEGVIGAAYRPVYNDRFNALLKYTYYEDLSPSVQISSGNETELARQKSEIFSVDGIYDLTEKLSIGGKYGFRSGEVAFDRTSDDFIKSDAHIGVVRFDYHVVKAWDIIAEGRWLSSSLAEDEQFGALLGVYRHVGDNAKIGAGYSFSKFSDDLTDFDQDNDGVFINLVGKF